MNQMSLSFRPSSQTIDMEPSEALSRATFQFDTLWALPKQASQTLGFPGNQGYALHEYNNYTHRSNPLPSLFQKYIDEDRYKWTNMVLNGASLGMGILPEVLSLEMLKCMQLPNQYGVRLSCSDLDFKDPKVDHILYGPSFLPSNFNVSRIPMIGFGIDIVGDITGKPAYKSLAEKGYSVYIHPTGLVKGNINLRRYNNQEANIEYDDLISGAITVLNKAIYTRYNMTQGVSIIKMAADLKEKDFVDSFFQYAKDLQYRMYCISSEGANLVSTAAQQSSYMGTDVQRDSRMMYAQYLYEISEIIAKA